MVLRQKLMEGKSQQAAAAASGMSVRTARTWQRGRLPLEKKGKRRWRTRPDPFAAVWAEEVELINSWGDTSGSESWTVQVLRVSGSPSTETYSRFLAVLLRWQGTAGRECLSHQDFGGCLSLGTHHGHPGHCSCRRLCVPASQGGTVDLSLEGQGPAHQASWPGLDAM